PYGERSGISTPCAVTPGGHHDTDTPSAASGRPTASPTAATSSSLRLSSTVRMRNSASVTTPATSSTASAPSASQRDRLPRLTRARPFVGCARGARPLAAGRSLELLEVRRAPHAALLFPHGDQRAALRLVAAVEGDGQLVEEAAAVAVRIL